LRRILSFSFEKTRKRWERKQNAVFALHQFTSPHFPFRRFTGKCRLKRVANVQTFRLEERKASKIHLEEDLQEQERTNRSLSWIASLESKEGGDKRQRSSSRPSSGPCKMHKTSFVNKANEGVRGMSIKAITSSYKRPTWSRTTSRALQASLLCPPCLQGNVRT